MGDRQMWKGAIVDSFYLPYHAEHAPCRYSTSYM